LGIRRTAVQALRRNTSILGDGRSIDCAVVFPEEDGAERHPAVIVIHEIMGPNEHIQDVCRRISELGYVVAAPDLFTGPLRRILTPTNIGVAMRSLSDAPPELRRDPAKMAEFAASQPPERRPLLEAFARVSAPNVQEGFTRDLLAVGQYLRSLPEVDPSRLASVGFCFGGSMSARLATADPLLRAAVIFYGYAPPLEAVPSIRARVLGFYGSEDPGVTQAVPAFAAAMASAGKRFEYQVYPSAKHGFFNDTRPNYHRMSANDAWDRMVRFFGETLNR
jgi:carboxymethylenebutenolidase